MIEDVSTQVGDIERILVAGHPYMEYTRMVARGFMKLGLSVHCLEWEIPKRSPLEHMQSVMSKGYVEERNRRMSEACARSLEHAAQNCEF